MKEFWNERFAAEEFVYGKEPNEFFKKQLVKLKPGKLLLPCEGEGRNAVFAALKKWDTYAVDQSEKGKEKCMLLAKEFKVAVNYIIADVAELDFGENKYDLIAMIYAHFPPDTRKKIHKKCAAALKAGGIIILEAFNPQQLNNTSGGPQNEDMLYTELMLKEDFSNLNIEYIETLKTVLKEGMNHAGPADIIRLKAVKDSSYKKK